VHTDLQATHNSGASGASASVPLAPHAAPLQGAAPQLQQPQLQQPQLQQPQQQRQPAPLVLDLRGPSHRSSAFSRNFPAAATPAGPPPAAAPAPPQPTLAPEAAAQSGGGVATLLSLLANIISADGAGASGAPAAGE
jgi:hypothetical protein